MTMLYRHQMMSLFDPLVIRSLTIKNRIWVSPMCQYSAINGLPNDWHFAHLAQFAMGGAGLIFTEATAISSSARSTAVDTGIWNEEQVASWTRIVGFIHEQGAKFAIQLWHAGRKGSATTPWEGHRPVSIDTGGWEIFAPSPLRFGELNIPIELSKADIQIIIQDYKSAAERSLRAGFDVVEIHGAHGYLIHSFLSPIGNKRIDEYGGEFLNRVRFLLEVTKAIREVWPLDKPLFVRLSTSDWVEEGWTVEDSIELAKLLKVIGVDLIDCSTGGVVPDVKYQVGPHYQVQFAEKIKSSAGILTGAVGLITDPLLANSIVASEQADAVLLGREMLRNPHWAFQAAHELGVDIEWPNQYKQAKPRKDWPY